MAAGLAVPRAWKRSRRRVASRPRQPAPPVPSTDASTAPYVAAETAPLRQVVVHTPGEEMALVAPGNAEDLLFDDILALDVARQEHATLVRVFQSVAGPDAVLQLGALAAETFEAQDAREAYVETLVRLMPERNMEAYAGELRALPADALLRFAFTGQAPFPVTAHPLPNLIFTRDLAAVVCDHVVLGSAATTARRPEGALVRTVFEHHPRFAALADKRIELSGDVTFEGGDLLVVSDEIVMIGQSERTSLGGVLRVAEALVANTPVQHVLMVNLPEERYCMHLDTVFTFADASTCVVFPPIITEARHQVVHLEAGDEPGRFQMRILPSVQVALEELTGREMTFIPCGGDDPIMQRREQWTDGANLFALRPGLVVGYERNHRTYDALREHGFHTVDADHFLGFYGDAPASGDQKIAIRLTGHELSRGRGGPRCLTMPLVRSEA